MAAHSTYYREILQKLDAVRRRENRLRLVWGIEAALLWGLGVVLAAVLLEQVFRFGTAGRTVLVAAAALAAAVSAALLAGKPLLTVLGLAGSSTDEDLANRVGGHYAHIRDRLLDALQVYRERERLGQYYSVSLIDASFADLYGAIHGLDFLEAVSDARVRRMGKFLAYGAALFALTVLVSPVGFYGSFNRILHPGTSFAATLPVHFSVEPGNVEVVRGQSVAVRVHATGKKLTSITLLVRQSGQIDFESRELRPDSEGVFSTEITNLKVNTEYLAASEDTRSEKYTIRVMDRPLIRSLQLTVAAPSYTRIPLRSLDENTGDVSAYPGSRVTLRLEASKALSHAAILYQDSTELPLTLHENEASASFTVRKNTSYHLMLEDTDGLRNIDPVEYAIRVIPDEYPTVEILSPGRNVDLTGEMALMMFIRAKDDFGFTRLALAYRLTSSRYEKPQEEFTKLEIPLPAGAGSQADVSYRWDLSSMGLVPEDVIAYCAEVYDNDNVSGPKAGRSALFTLRLPSLEEVLADVSDTHQQSMESMQSLSKEAQELRKEMEDVQRDMKKGAEKMDWQEKRKAEEMASRYDAMQKKLAETAQKLDDVVKKMQENRLLSPETLEKYQELQKLMEQLNSPELRDALKKLQESMKQLSPEQMRQAMEQLKFSEEQFRQSLERTVELLKRIHIEQKLDELIKRAEDLAKQQESLREKSHELKTADQAKRDEMAARQEDLAHQMKSLEKEASELQEKMEEFPKEMPLSEMDSANASLKSHQIPRTMQSSAEQMKSGNMSQSQENQKEAEQNLQEFQKEMQNVQKTLREKQMKQIVQAMRKQLENVLELSQRQESLKDETKGLDANSQRFRDQADAQSDVMSDLANVANALAEISKKTFAVSPEMGKEIGSAMKQMGEALQNMEVRNPRGSSDKQAQAMGSLNRAAEMMQGSLNSLMQGQQGGMGMAGLMGQLQQMAQAQGGINAATQQAMAQGQLTAQQQAEYERLAGSQGAVQKSLEDLSREAKNTGEFSKLLGDLDKVADEMKEVQTDLEQGHVNPQTIQKQERILSRLLESTRSMRERDYEKKRKAEPGKQLPMTSPPEIDLTTQEGRNALRQELLKAMEGRYSKEYEELIRRYFEELEKEEETINR